MFSLIQKVFAKTGQQPGTIDLSEVDPLKGATITTILDRIIIFLASFGAPIAIILVIIGAYQMLTAGAKPDNFRKGRQTILYALAGYGIILMSYAILALIEEILKGTSSS